MLALHGNDTVGIFPNNHLCLVSWTI
jgi:hypothetical protein